MPLANQALVGANNKVIVSFTTVSSRINYIEPMVNSILNQTVQPDSFELYISDHPSLFKNGFDQGIPSDKIPQFLLDLSAQGKLQIKYVPNIGPANKLIPALLENRYTNNVIITVDDDHIYPDYLISLLLHNYHKHNHKYPVALIGTKPNIRRGILLPSRSWHFIKRKDKFSNAFIHGVGGALYKSSFFHTQIFNTSKLLNLSAKNDDIWFHFMRLAKNIPVLIIPRPFPTPLWTLPQDTERLIYSNVYKQQNDIFIRNVSQFMNANLSKKKKNKLKNKLKKLREKSSNKINKFLVMKRKLKLKRKTP